MKVNISVTLPTVENDPSIKSQLASRKLTSGPDVVQIWSRDGRMSQRMETRKVHRVGNESHKLVYQVLNKKGSNDFLGRGLPMSDQKG